MYHKTVKNFVKLSKSGKFAVLGALGRFFQTWPIYIHVYGN